MTKTIMIDAFFDILNMFGILNFGHCDLFGICDLWFGIYGLSEQDGFFKTGKLNDSKQIQ